MKKPKNKKNDRTSLSILKVKTGAIEVFFLNAKTIMRAADSGEPIKKRCATLTFVDPTEMLHFLSTAKIKLINSIRKKPDSITNIALATKRNRSAVYRDIYEMEKFGLVKSHEEINPGHGRRKIIELLAPTLKLEAYV